MLNECWTAFSRQGPEPRKEGWRWRTHIQIPMDQLINEKPVGNPGEADSAPGGGGAQGCRQTRGGGGLCFLHPCGPSWFPELFFKLGTVCDGGASLQGSVGQRWNLHLLSDRELWGWGHGRGEAPRRRITKYLRLQDLPGGEDRMCSDQSKWGARPRILPQPTRKTPHTGCQQLPGAQWPLLRLCTTPVSQASVSSCGAHPAPGRGALPRVLRHPPFLALGSVP